MSTPMYLFMGFIALGMIFFFTGCFLAARPASGTTEWINYKCGRKLTFCPTPKPLTKFDIIPIITLAAVSFGVTVLTAAFLTKLDNSAPLSLITELPLFRVGENHYDLMQLLFVLIVSLTYIFLKNLTGGYLIPISGSVLFMLDFPSLILSHSTDMLGVSLFVLTAFYLAYRYTTLSDETPLSKRASLFLGMGITLGVGAAFNASVISAIIGIIAIFAVKEFLFYFTNKTDDNKSLKNQIFKRAAVFVPFTVILPMILCFGITTLCTIGEHTTFADYIANAYDIVSYQLSFTGDIYSLMIMSTLGSIVCLGSIFALPCCIYQVIKAKDGISLFVLIPFAAYILSIFISGFSGLLPIFAIPVITRCFAALQNRKLKYWILVYLFTAALYIGFILAFNVM